MSGRTICITIWEKPRDRRGIPTGSPARLIVSHGIEEDTGRRVTLPCDSPESLGAVFDQELREWVIEAAEPRAATGRAARAAPRS